MDNVQHEVQRLSATNKRSRKYEEEDPVVARVADAVVPDFFKGSWPDTRVEPREFSKTPVCVFEWDQDVFDITQVLSGRVRRCSNLTGRVGLPLIRIDQLKVTRPSKKRSPWTYLGTGELQVGYRCAP